MGYEFNENDVFSFADLNGHKTTKRGKELHFTYCPYCLGGKHNDKETFSINLKTGAFKCLRSSCNKSGHFVELARDFNFPLDFGETKQYKELPQKAISSNDAAIKYLESRCIGEETAKKYKITTQNKDANILVFPFYDENGVLVSAKYRKCNYDKSRDKNKEWFEAGTKPILFGMAQCEDFGRLVITEGQLDSLSVAASGIKNAVSVPNGATGFTWIANVWEWISKFKEIVIFGDMENGKMTLLDTLLKRLNNKILAVQKEYYLGEKDANDILKNYGSDAVRKAVENASPVKVKNVIELSDVKSVDINTLEKIKTNIAPIDRIIGGLIMGQVILLTGKSGHGKSTFMSQLVCEALEQNESVFIYSGELAGYHFKRWLDYQLAGSEHLVENKNEYDEMTYTIKPDIVKRLNSWYKGRAFIYDNSYIDGLQDEAQEKESLLQTVEKVVKQYGTRLVCIDNLMTAMDGTGANELYREQGNFVGELKRMAVKYNIAVILVAHPKKSKDGKDDLVNDDVLGSSDITNKVDVVMSYKRKDDEVCGGILSITKNRLFGRYARGEGAIQLCYSDKTKRITPFGTENKKYSWECPFGEVVSASNELWNFDAAPF